MRIRETTAWLKDILEDLRGNAAARAKNASLMGRRAAKRGDKDSQDFWAGVYERAKAQIGAAGSSTSTGQASPKPSLGSDSSTSSPSSKVEGDITSKVSNLLKKVARGASSALAGPSKKLQKLEPSARKLVTDKMFRRKASQEAVAAVKKIPPKNIYDAAVSSEEVSRAGGVLLKAAASSSLDDHDKKLLKDGAKALATAVLAGTSIKSMDASTTRKLAAQFAADAAVKSVGKAALYMSAISKNEEALATTAAWAQNVVHGVQVGFATLGSLSDEDLVDILSGDSEDDEEEEEA